MAEGLTALLPRGTSPLIALPLFAVVWLVVLVLELHLAVAVPIALRENLGVVRTLRRVLALTRGEHANWTAHAFAALFVVSLPFAVAVSTLEFLDQRIEFTIAWVVAAGLFGPMAFALHERLLAYEQNGRQHPAGA